MRALFLGAGASSAAGYPLGSELLRAVEVFFESRAVDVTTLNRWKRYVAFRDSADGLAAQVLKCQNPEVALSFIDLCIEALSARNAEFRAAERCAIKDAELAPSEMQSGLMSSLGDRLEELSIEITLSRLTQATHAAVGMREGIYAFLEQKHAADWEPGAVNRREALQQELALLQPGDIVLTTNYDTLAERILLDRGLWHPGDGYGFKVSLSPTPAGERMPMMPAPEWTGAPSRIRVLKLHGSYGWRTGEGVGGPGLFLDAMLFQSMPVVHNGEVVPVYDVREKRFPPPITRPVLAYPSFLKQTDGPELRGVWDLARDSLADVTDLRIVGASLPASDVGVRVLLAPLRTGVAERAVNVSVVDPSQEAYDRWRDLLGSNVAWDGRCVGDPVVAG